MPTSTKAWQNRGVDRLLVMPGPSCNLKTKKLLPTDNISMRVSRIFLEVSDVKWNVWVEDLGASP